MLTTTSKNSPLSPSDTANLASTPATTLHAIAYYSDISLTAALYHDTFIDIEQKSRHNNQRTGTTGFLCFKHGRFFQYIEGETLTILNLMNVIKQDPRHHSITVIVDTAITERRFSGWAMHCFNLNEPSPEHPVSHYLVAFEPKTWDIATAEEVITSVQRLYDHARTQQPITCVPEKSYARQLISAKSVPVVRLIAIAIAIVAVLLLVCAMLWLGFFDR